MSKRSNTGKVGKTIDEPRMMGMAVFDQLPPRIRRRLAEATINITSVRVMDALRAGASEQVILEAIERTERDNAIDWARLHGV